MVADCFECRPTFSEGLHSTSLVASPRVHLQPLRRHLRLPEKHTPVGRLLPRSLEVLLEV